MSERTGPNPLGLILAGLSKNPSSTFYRFFTIHFSFPPSWVWDRFEMGRIEKLLRHVCILLRRTVCVAHALRTRHSGRLVLPAALHYNSYLEELANLGEKRPRVRHVRAKGWAWEGVSERRGQIGCKVEYWNWVGRILVLNETGYARYRARRTENQTQYSEAFELILVWDHLR